MVTCRQGTLQLEFFYVVQKNYTICYSILKVHQFLLSKNYTSNTILLKEYPVNVLTNDIFYFQHNWFDLDYSTTIASASIRQLALFDGLFFGPSHQKIELELTPFNLIIIIIEFWSGGTSLTYWNPGRIISGGRDVFWVILSGVRECHIK